MDLIQNNTSVIIRQFADIFIFITGFTLAYLALMAYKKSSNARMLFFSLGFIFITLAGLMEGNIESYQSLMFASAISGYLFVLLGFFTQKSKAKIYLNILSGISIFILLFLVAEPVLKNAITSLYIFTSFLSLAITLFFINNYLKSKDNTSLMFSYGFFILFLSEILLFMQFNRDFSHILKLPAFLVLAYLLLNENQRDTLWTNIHPVREELPSGTIPGKKHPLKSNGSYIADTSKSSMQAYELFSDYVFHGREGLCFSKTNPDRIREITKLKRTPIVWLTGSEYAGGIKPENISQVIELSSRYISESKNAIILLDGIEYLIEHNTFDKILRMIKELKTHTLQSGSNIIVTVDSNKITPEEKTQLNEILKPI